MSNFPYTSSPKSIEKVFELLTRQFPNQIDAKYLKRNAIAPNNESYLLNILQFLSLIDEAGKKHPENSKALLWPPNEDVHEKFAAIVQNAYQKVFEDKGEDAWTSDSGELEHFFRVADSTSKVVGERQARTFTVLAELAGKRQKSQLGRTVSQLKNKGEKKPSKSPAGGTTKTGDEKLKDGGKNISLNVRIEINLPANATRENYDEIFKSIRENLTNE